MGLHLMRNAMKNSITPITKLLRDNGIKKTKWVKDEDWLGRQIFNLEDYGYSAGRTKKGKLDISFKSPSLTKKAEGLLKNRGVEIIHVEEFLLTVDINQALSSINESK